MENGLKVNKENKTGSFITLSVDGGLEDIPDYIEALTYALRKIAFSEDIDENAICRISFLIEGLQLSSNQMFTIDKSGILD